MRIRNSVKCAAALIAVVGLCAVIPGGKAKACSSTRCIVVPGCAKSVVQGKAFVTVVAGLVPPGGTVTVPVSVLVTSGDSCGGTCSPLPTVTEATTFVGMNPGFPPCVPPFAGTGTVTTTDGSMPTPTCSSAGDTTSYTVPVTFAAGALPGIYCIFATTTITFSDGMVLIAAGDMVLCIVEEAPGMPGVPRLDMVLDTTGFINDMPHCAPGDQMNLEYLVTNNDPTESVTLTPTATSTQAARLPETDPPGMDEEDGVYAISSSKVGDDFPIMFDPPPGFCILLPPDPPTYVQEPITGSEIVIPPGGSATITVAIRSYSACSNGSCSETALTVEGTFSDGDPAFACTGTTLWVDTSIPFPGGQEPCEPCGFPENDCNNNGVYDSLDVYVNQTSPDCNFNAHPDECDIEQGVSQDQNGNGIPDECEAPCEGDANGDGAVDPLDSGFVLARFGCAVGTGDPDCDAADQNGDGAVDPLDSGFVLARFGPCP